MAANLIPLKWGPVDGSWVTREDALSEDETRIADLLCVETNCRLDSVYELADAGTPNEHYMFVGWNEEEES